MATDRPPRPQSRFASSRPSHETRDASVPWIIGIVVFLFLSGVAIELMLGGMLKNLRRSPPVTDRWRPVGAAVNRRSFAAAQFPKLQVSPTLDLQTFRAHEDAELKSYGWVDKTSGIVRIPIARAMDLLLQKGLPVRQGTNEIKPGPSSFELQQQRALQRSPADQNHK